MSNKDDAEGQEQSSMPDVIYAKSSALGISNGIWFDREYKHIAMPKGKYYSQSHIDELTQNLNKLELLAEDLEAHHKWLDDEGAPRFSVDEIEYSAQGRVSQLIYELTQKHEEQRKLEINHAYGYGVRDGESNKKEALKAQRIKYSLIARYGCLVPPDGGSPTDEESRICDFISEAILNAGDV